MKLFRVNDPPSSAIFITSPNIGVERLAAILPGWARVALDVLESVSALGAEVCRFLVMVQTLGHGKTARPAQVRPVEVIPLEIHDTLNIVFKLESNLRKIVDIGRVFIV